MLTLSCGRLKKGDVAVDDDDDGQRWACYFQKVTSADLVR
jgi:hypothetical protein